DIPIDRRSAIAGHKKAGFKETGIVNGKCVLELSKDDFLDFKKSNQLYVDNIEPFSSFVFTHNLKRARGYTILNFSYRA
ncbi:MAG TPA: hypothetical protein DCM73_14460, partial [Clostridiales bacterium]|nr:hypothetical protein [Clostridiales bacterium]